MNWEAIGAVAEFVGALAVVLTLLYLAIQVRSGVKTNTLNAVQANRELRIQMFYWDRDSPYWPSIQAKLDAGEELSPEERIRHRTHLSAQWVAAYADWVQRDLGLMGEYATKTLVVDLLIQNPNAMEWWDDVGASIYPQRFVDYISSERNIYHA